MIEQNTSNVKLLSFQQAKELAKALNIKSFEEWVEFYKSGKFESKLIPLYPEHVYSEWKSWDDFFNLKENEQTNEHQETLTSKTKKGVKNRKDFLSYEEAKEYLKNKGLTFGDWREYCKNKPNFIPSDPYNQYRNTGWVDWYEFLNYKKKEKLFIENEKEINSKTTPIKRKYLSYEKAKEFLKDKGLKNCDWKEYSKTSPSFIPKNPYNVYRYKGWVNWQDFLSYTGKGKKNIIINDPKSNKLIENEASIQKIKQTIVC
jgi:hypothetical protein